MKVSVIVPVHNSAAHLQDCMASLQVQSFRDFEALFIDDGSTDESPQLLDRFAAEDARVKIIAQPAKGPSAARNAGLDAATGEYIGFLDSDDVAVPEWLATMVALADSRGSDMAVLGFARFYGDDPNQCHRQPCTAPEHLIGSSFTLADLDCPASEVLTPALWRTFWRRSFIEENRLRLPEELRTAEDLAFTYCALACNPAMTLCSDPLYRYRCSHGGTLTTARRGSAGIAALQVIYRYALDRGLLEEPFLHHFANVCVSTADYGLTTAVNWEEFQEIWDAFGQWAAGFVREHRSCLAPPWDGSFSAMDEASAEEYLFGLLQRTRQENRWLRSDVAAEQARVDEARREVEELRRSTSFRAGHALVKPFAGIRDAVRGRKKGE